MNRVDHIAGNGMSRSCSAKRMSVFVNGVLRSDIYTKRIEKGGYPDFARAMLGLMPLSVEAMMPTAVEQLVPTGSSIRVIEPVSTGDGIEMFKGFVERIETTIDDTNFSIDITARDVSCLLENITVLGKRIANDNQSVHISGLDTIFNPEGRSNASKIDMQFEGRKYKAFAASEGDGRAWSYADVIHYLICEYAPAWLIKVPSKERLDTLCRSRTVCDLDVTGLKLIEALQRCCSKIGIRYCFEPLDTGDLWALRFWREGSGRAVELNSQHGHEVLDASKTQIAAVESVKICLPVKKRYWVQGDYKMFESTFELVAAWDPLLETMDMDVLNPATNPEFYKVRDVYRKWCLNEAGNYGAAAYDLSNTFGTDEYVRTRRRFWPALTCDRQGRSLGYYLQVSYDNGNHWWQYLHAFNNLLDECGIWLSGEQFDFDTWWAALKGVLKFRITASVVSDERLSSTVVDGPAGWIGQVADTVVMRPRTFKYRRVCPMSIFYKSQDPAIGKANEVDDTASLVECARTMVEAGYTVTERVKVHTPIAMSGYAIGDVVVCSPESRDVLGVQLNNRSVYVIERVMMDLEKQQSVLEIKRIAKSQ